MRLPTPAAAVGRRARAVPRARSAWRWARGVWPSPRHGAHTARRQRPPLTLPQRRARALLGGAALFALIVLVTSFPLGTLLSQRSQLASASGEVTRLSAADQSLTRQVAQLSDPAIVTGIARRDFGLVPKGARAYAVLPPPLTAADAKSQPPALSGQPVAPDSARSETLLGLNPSAPLPAALRAPVHDASGATATAGYWTRVAQTLEFWR